MLARNGEPAWKWPTLLHVGSGHVHVSDEGHQASGLIHAQSIRHYLPSSVDTLWVLPQFHQNICWNYTQYSKSTQILFTVTISNSVQTSWGSREDGDTNDNERMSPRGRRSESITMPPGNHPGLIRYNDEKTFVRSSSTDAKGFTTAYEKAVVATPDAGDTAVGSDDDSASDSDISDTHTDSSDDFDDSSNSSSMVMEARGR